MLAKLRSFLFHNTSTRQTVAKNTFWLAVSNFGSRAIRAVIVVYAARLLGAENWGVFSYALTLGTFLTFFSDLGIGQILIRELAKENGPETQNKIVSTSFYLKTAAGILAALITWLVAPLLSAIPAAGMVYPYIALIILFDTLRDFGFYYVRSREKMQQEAGLFLLTNLAMVIFGFLALRAHPTIRAFALIYAAGSGVGTLATYYVLRQDLLGLWRSFSAKTAKFILKNSWPIAIASLMGVFMTNTDVVIVGWFRGAADVGIYSAVNRIIQLLYVVPSILATSSLPLFSRLARAGEKERAGSIVGRLLAATQAFAIPAAVGGAIVAAPLLVLIFGPEYASGAPSFMILMASLVVNYSSVILANCLFANDGQRKLIWYSAAAALVNVGLDFAFIPRWGITGSAWATLLAQVAGNVYLWYALHHIVPISLWPRLKKIALAAAAMGIAVGAAQLWGLPVLICISIGAVVYGGSLLALKETLLREGLQVRNETI